MKNNQGFVMLGMNFDTNYGQKINACCQFEFKGFEISVSTGACQPSKNNYPVGPSPILVTNLKTEEKFNIEGSVQDAIVFVLEQPANNEYRNECLSMKDEDDLIKMKEFNASESECDSLYNNSKYDEKFKVETRYGDIITVSLTWVQGRLYNYRFLINDNEYLLPEEISKVQVL